MQNMPPNPTRACLYFLVSFVLLFLLFYALRSWRNSNTVSDRVNKSFFADNNLKSSYSSDVSSESISSRSVVENDLEKIEEILYTKNHIETANSWNASILFVKTNDENSLITYYHYNSIYHDTNENSIQDEGDSGFFNPASTIKVGIAALALEKMNSLGLSKESKYRQNGTQTWYSIASDIEQSLVISSNESANRLILFVGFDSIRSSLKAKGLKQFSVNRLMLNQGVLVDSPSFDVFDPMQNREVILNPRSVSSQELVCLEAKEQIGNCSSAVDLVGVLRRIVQPEDFLRQEIFNLREEDRLWIQEILAQTPRDMGFDKEDTFCRFLQPLYEEKRYVQGRLLSKCGVALFSHSFIDTSFLQTDDNQKYYVVFAVNPPSRISKSQAIEWMNTVSSSIIDGL